MLLPVLHDIISSFGFSCSRFCCACLLPEPKLVILVVCNSFISSITIVFLVFNLVKKSVAVRNSLIEDPCIQLCNKMVGKTYRVVTKVECYRRYRHKTVMET